MLSTHWPWPAAQEQCLERLLNARKEMWSHPGLRSQRGGGVQAVAKHTQRSLLLAQSNVQQSWAGGIKICPCQTFVFKTGRIIGTLGFFSYRYKHLRKQKLFKIKCWQKKSLPLLTLILAKYVFPLLHSSSSNQWNY